MTPAVERDQRHARVYPDLSRVGYLDEPPGEIQGATRAGVEQRPPQGCPGQESVRLEQTGSAQLRAIEIDQGSARTAPGKRTLTEEPDGAGADGMTPALERDQGVRHARVHGDRPVERLDHPAGEIQGASRVGTEQRAPQARAGLSKAAKPSMHREHRLSGQLRVVEIDQRGGARTTPGELPSEDPDGVAAQGVIAA